MPLRSALQFFFRPQHLPQEMRGFYVHVFLQRVADALLFIALPLSLFSFGKEAVFFQSFSFFSSFERGMLSVLLYYGSARLLIVLFTPVLSRVFFSLGVVRTMILGQLCLVASYLALASLSSWQELYFVLPFVRAIGIFCYWVGHNSYFSSSAQPKILGEEVSVMEFLVRLSTLSAPLVAAFLIVNIGYPAVFLSSSVLHVISSLSLLALPNFHADVHWSWSDFWTAFVPKFRNMWIGIAGYTWEDFGIGIIWPLFLFIAFENVKTVSYIFSAASLASLLLVYLTGVIFDGRHQSSKLQIFSGMMLGLLWIPRSLFIHFPLTLVATETMDRLVSGVYGTLFSATLFWHSRKEGTFIFQINREIFLSLVTLVGMGLCLCMLLIQWSWTLLFLSFLVGAVLSLLFRREK